MDKKAEFYQVTPYGNNVFEVMVFDGCEDNDLVRGVIYVVKDARLYCISTNELIPGEDGEPVAKVFDYVSYPSNELAMDALERMIGRIVVSCIPAEFLEKPKDIFEINQYSLSRMLNLSLEYCGNGLFDTRKARERATEILKENYPYYGNLLERFYGTYGCSSGSDS